MLASLRTKLGIGKNSISAKQYVQTLNLTDKPYAEALFLRAATLIDESASYSEVKLPSFENTTIPDFAKIAVMNVSIDILNKAGEFAGREVHFTPEKSLPEDSALIVTYLLFVVTIITGTLKDLHLNYNYESVVNEVAGQPFITRPLDERVKVAMQGIQTFKELSVEGNQNIATWHDNLAKTIPMYIMQWTSTDSKVKDYDLQPILGSLLKSLLKAAAR